MTGVIATLPKSQFSNALGLPMSGGTLTSYLAGTTTPVATYQDEALSAANTNPIALDSRGECTLWLDSTKTYKFVLKNALGVVQWTVDNITNSTAFAQAVRNELTAYKGELAGSSGASLVGYMLDGGVATTVDKKLGQCVSVMDFGVTGLGTNETALIQNAVNSLGSGDELVFPSGFNFGTEQIVLSGKTNFSIRISGKVTNVATKAGGTAVNANTAERGLKATFYITNCSNFSITGEGSINNGFREAFCIGENLSANTAAPCTDFEISINLLGSGVNDNIHGNRFRYCSRFTIRDMRVNQVTKKPAYINNASAYYHDFCEALLFWDCTDFTVKGVTSSNNAMNGIYIGSNCSRFTITDNDLEHNGASGLQMSWSSFGIAPTHFIISNNRACFNRADGYDLNNTGAQVEANGTVIGNLAYYCGYGSEDETAANPTNDGSGYTLVKFKKLNVIGNHDVECSRKFISYDNCTDSNIIGNVAKKTNASLDLTGDPNTGIYIASGYNVFIQGNSVSTRSTKNAMRIDGANPINVKIECNYFDGIVDLGAGYSPVGCAFNKNTVLSTTRIYACIDMSGNTITISGEGQTGLYVNKDNVILDGNTVSAPNFGIIVSSNNYVKILNNKVVAGDGGIRVDNSIGTKISGNDASGVGSPGIHLLGASTNCEVSMNKGASTGGNGIRLESTCITTHHWGNFGINNDFQGTHGINF